MTSFWKRVLPQAVVGLVAIFVGNGYRIVRDDLNAGLSTADALRHAALIEVPVLLAIAISALFGWGLWALAWRWLKPRM